MKNMNGYLNVTIGVVIVSAARTKKLEDFPSWLIFQNGIMRQGCWMKQPHSPSRYLTFSWLQTNWMAFSLTAWNSWQLLTMHKLL